MKSTEQIYNQIIEAKSYEPQDLRDNLHLISYLDALIEQRGVSKKALLTQVEIESTIGYKLLRGERTMKRDPFLKLLIGLELSVDEVQYSLKQFEFSPLYAKNKRDAALIYCINNKYSYSNIKRYFSKHNIIQL